MLEQQTEREDTFEVPADFSLPDLHDLLPEGGRVETVELHLVNTYLDTASSYLAQLRITLRRREGGYDAGWHLKLPADDARLEITDASTASTLPDSLASLVVGVCAGEELGPVAQVTVERTAVQLLGADGSVLVEVADDRVSGLTLGSQSRVSSWREVEVELKAHAGTALQGRVGERLESAGARRSEYRSKLRRTLGLPAHPRTAPDLGTVGGLAWVYVAEQGEEIVRCDLRLRLGEPLIHKYRVAIRRLRSTLRVFAPLFEVEAVAALEAELVWFAGLLGEVRDRDVLLLRLAEQVAELPAEVVLGPVAAHIETTLLLERSEHQARLGEAMDADRYARLLRQVVRWQTRPPLTGRADRPVADARRYLGRAERKVDQRLAAADGDVEALHGARKAAKRYRYAAELSAQAGGKKAARIVRSTTKLQTLLGEHQDSVVSAAFLRRLGAQAGADSTGNGFTYGYLMALELQRAARIRDEADRRWGKKRR